jgi:hypothetical protein
MTDGGRFDLDAAIGSHDGGGPGGSTGSTKGICARSGECEEAITVTSAAHTTGTIIYEDRPPAGGPHNPCWAQWGVHDQPAPVENWVHNLEHGGVVLLYNCDGGCGKDIDSLKTFVAAHDRTLLTEYVDMDARFAVVAWGYRLLFRDALDLDAVAAFYAAHFDHGLESISSPPGAQCP